MEPGELGLRQRELGRCIVLLLLLLLLPLLHRHGILRLLLLDYYCGPNYQITTCSLRSGCAHGKTNKTRHTAEDTKSPVSLPQACRRVYQVWRHGAPLTELNNSVERSVDMYE